MTVIASVTNMSVMLRPPSARRVQNNAPAIAKAGEVELLKDSGMALS